MAHMPVARWARITALALSLAAAGVATYLTVTHYTNPTSLACPNSGVVNCTLVTTSSWSEFLGAPVAVLGLVWALAMVVVTLPWAWRSVLFDRGRLALSALGAVAVLYLVFVELFRIGAICLWCTAIHVLAVGLFGVVLAGRAAVRRTMYRPTKHPQ